MTVREYMKEQDRTTYVTIWYKVRGYVKEFEDTSLLWEGYAEDWHQQGADMECEEVYCAPYAREILLKKPTYV